MTITNTTTDFRYEGNGSTDTFAFTGRIFSVNDLVVEIITRATDALVETLTITTDYTVTINGPESATVEVTNAAKIPSASQDIQIRRSLSKTQTVDLPTGTVFPAVSVENALDKNVAIIQEQSTELGRAVKLPATSSLTNIELPTPVASELIGWNPTADGLTTFAFSELSTSLDVLLSGLTSGDLLQYNGTNWVNIAAIDTSNIEDSAITTAKLADDAVTPIKIESGVNAIGSIGGGTQNIDLDDGRTVTATVDTSTTTFTFSNPKATGKADAFDLILTNGGSQTINWPASVDWPGGTAPTLTASGLDHLVFTTNDGGTTWYGYVVGLDLQ